MASTPPSTTAIVRSYPGTTKPPRTRRCAEEACTKTVVVTWKAVDFSTTKAKRSPVAPPATWVICHSYLAAGSTVRPSQPSCCTNLSTRLLMSSRSSRIRSAGCPFGSSKGQSARRSPGTTGHSSPHPIVMSKKAPRAMSGSSFWGLAAERSRPTSSMTWTTSGCTHSAGRVPAEMARAAWRLARALKKAAAICERPALWTHAKITVFIEMAPLQCMPATPAVFNFQSTPWANGGRPARGHPGPSSRRTGQTLCCSTTRAHFYYIRNDLRWLSSALGEVLLLD